MASAPAVTGEITGGGPADRIGLKVIELLENARVDGGKAKAHLRGTISTGEKQTRRRVRSN